MRWLFSFYHFYIPLLFHFTSISFHFYFIFIPLHFFSCPFRFLCFLLPESIRASSLCRTASPPFADIPCSFLQYKKRPQTSHKAHGPSLLSQCLQISAGTTTASNACSRGLPPLQAHSIVVPVKKAYHPKHCLLLPDKFIFRHKILLSTLPDFFAVQSN